MITLGLGSRGAGYEHLKSDWKIGLRISIHASSNEAQKGQIQQLEDLNLLGNDANIIHANAITRGQIEAVQRAGASITMTPYSEMRIAMDYQR